MLSLNGSISHPGTIRDLCMYNTGWCGLTSRLSMLYVQTLIKYSARYYWGWLELHVMASVVIEIREADILTSRTKGEELFKI